MVTTTVARHAHGRRRDGSEWVVPLILAAWVIVLVCGFLVNGVG